MLYAAYSMVHIICCVKFTLISFKKVGNKFIWWWEIFVKGKKFHKYRTVWNSKSIQIKIGPPRIRRLWNSADDSLSSSAKKVSSMHVVAYGEVIQWRYPTSSHPTPFVHVNWHMVPIIYAYSSLPINHSELSLLLVVHILISVKIIRPYT